MNQVEQFIASARSFEGTPFHHGGRVPGVGLDCIGVIVVAAQRCGMPVRDVAAYPLQPNGQLETELAAQLVQVYEARAGDILAMRFVRSGEPHHLAILTGATIIHAYMQAQRCVEQPYIKYWRDATRAIYRFPQWCANE